MDDSLLPNDEMDRLRGEIDLLKRKQGPAAKEENDPKEAIATLSRSINSLLRVFKDASEDMKMDTHDAVLVAQKLDRILDRLEKVEAQNEKIAKGIVAVADMLEEQDDKPKPMMPSRPMSPQQMQAQYTGGPEPKPLPTYNLPPDEKKKSFMNLKM